MGGSYYNQLMWGWHLAKNSGLREWSAALRELRENPVRQYLLLARRRRKLHFLLRPELARIPLVVAAGLLVIVLAADMLLADGAFGARLNQAARTTQVAYMEYISPWIGLPIALWWLQLLYTWAHDSLALFSKDRREPMALPEGSELALISRESILAGALSVLLPPILWSIALIALAGYTFLAWRDMANALLYIGDSKFTTGFPLSVWPLALVGWLAICVNGALVASLLTTALMIAGCSMRNSAMRSGCAMLVALQQPVATLAVNASYWWCVGTFAIPASPQHLYMALAVVFITLVVFWTAALDWLASFQRVKSLVLVAALIIMLCMQGLAPVMLWEITSSYRELISVQIAMPYLWLLAFAILVNPVAVPDLGGLFGDRIFFYELTNQYPPTAWLVYPPVMLVLLLALTLYALRCATRQVDRWRCAD